VLVPTPIGNLSDITQRAVQTLQQADRIAAEDTRHSGILLKHLGIAKPLTSLHQHNEHRTIPALLAEVHMQNLTLAVISDAGTPGISDPGYLIVRQALRVGIPVEVLPGATAFVPALVGSGLPASRFTFEGFLPVKKGRLTRLRELANESRTLVFYESPHRLLRTLQDLAEHMGAERPCAIARELTKIHEEMYRGTLQTASAHFGKGTVKGEIVMVIAGAGYDPGQHVDDEIVADD